MAGLKARHRLEGRSFLPTLPGQQMPAQQRPLYFSRREGGTAYGGQRIYALRPGDWKLLQNSPYKPMERYSLKEDPREQNNLMARQPAVYKKRNTLLLQHLQEGGRVPWPKPEKGEPCK